MNQQEYKLDFIEPTQLLPNNISQPKLKLKRDKVTKKKVYGTLICNLNALTCGKWTTSQHQSAKCSQNHLPNQTFFYPFPLLPLLLKHKENFENFMHISCSLHFLNFFLLIPFISDNQPES